MNLRPLGPEPDSANHKILGNPRLSRENRSSIVYIFSRQSHRFHTLWCKLVQVAARPVPCAGRSYRSAQGSCPCTRGPTLPLTVRQIGVARRRGTYFTRSSQGPSSGRSRFRQGGAPKRRMTAHPHASARCPRRSRREHQRPAGVPNETQAIVADSCDLVDDQMERFLKHLESQDYVDVQTD